LAKGPRLHHLSNCRWIRRGSSRLCQLRTRPRCIRGQGNSHRPRHRSPLFNLCGMCAIYCIY
jgi:hypothetical protein